MVTGKVGVVQETPQSLVVTMTPRVCCTMTLRDRDDSEGEEMPGPSDLLC